MHLKIYQRVIHSVLTKGGENLQPELNIQLLEKEIENWRYSPRRVMQIKGFLYYNNEHDIIHRKRLVIGEKGELQEVTNLPNNRIIDNQYAKMVNQKANYLLGKPLTLDGGNDTYIELLKNVFDRKFMKTLKSAGKAAYNGGIAWLYPYYDENGKFAFRRFPAHEILPSWKNEEHTELERAVRVYPKIVYDGTARRLVEKAEIYDLQGVHLFRLEGSRLIPETDMPIPYVWTSEGQGFNWRCVPFIPIKPNEEEIPLLKKVKSLQDGINIMLSDFENNMQEDKRNTILIIKNYDGTDLGEFRQNLAVYGAVKVRNDSSAQGGVETLEITVNADNYKTIIEIFKKALIENAMGFDAKDDRLSGNPNQMNIQSMYSDIDTDADDMETEIQAAFDYIFWFINCHLENTGQGSFEGQEKDIDVVFNRDMLMNEADIINNCRNSQGIISDKTIIAMHPWVRDPQEEQERLLAQKHEEQSSMMEYSPFGQQDSTQEQDKRKGEE